jgi:hypothetical protein
MSRKILLDGLHYDSIVYPSKKDKPSIGFELEEKDGQACFEFTLTEKKAQAELKSVKLINLPANIIILQPDKLQINSIFVQKKENELTKATHRCDYLIITDKELVFIELKSYRNTDQSDSKKLQCTNKFKATNCLLKYIDSILNDLLDKQNFFVKLDQFYVVFYQSPSINKQPTFDNIQNTTPDKPKYIGVKNTDEVYFRRLLGTS